MREGSGRLEFGDFEVSAPSFPRFKSYCSHWKDFHWEHSSLDQGQGPSLAHALGRVARFQSNNIHKTSLWGQGYWSISARRTQKLLDCFRIKIYLAQYLASDNNQQQKLQRIKLETWLGELLQKLWVYHYLQLLGLILSLHTCQGLCQRWTATFAPFVHHLLSFFTYRNPETGKSLSQLLLGPTFLYYPPVGFLQVVDRTSFPDLCTNQLQLPPA